MHVGIVLAGALVGVVGAVVVHRLKHVDAPEPTEFVSADGSVVELPAEPMPLPAEGDQPTPVSETTDPVLLDPVPMSGIEVTVAHRTAEPVPEEKDAAPCQAPVEADVIPTPPASPEELPMPMLVESPAEEMPPTAVVSAPPSAVPEPVPAVPETSSPPPSDVEIPKKDNEPCPATPPPVAAVPPAGSTLVDEAKQAEANGNIKKAIELYTRIYRQNIDTNHDLAMEALNRAHSLQNASSTSSAEAPKAAVHQSPLPLPALVMAAAHKHASHVEPLPFTGTYDCTLENQGELNLSASARTELDRPRVLFVALAPDKKCLWVYTAAGIDRLSEQLDKASGNDEMARCTRRKCFSRIHRVHATTDGNFLIPVDLVEIACLTGNVLLIGVRDHFELWDAHQWQQYIGQEEPAEQTDTNSQGGITPASSGTAVTVQRSDPGRLRRAGFFVDGKQAFAFECRSGEEQHGMLLYVTAEPGLNLEPYVNRTVRLMGSVVFHGELRSNYMKATQVDLVPEPPSGGGCAPLDSDFGSSKEPAGNGANPGKAGAGLPSGIAEGVVTMF
jgi:MraZ protein